MKGCYVMYLSGIFVYFFNHLHKDGKVLDLFTENTFSPSEKDEKIQKALKSFLPLIFSPYKKYSKEVVESVYLSFLVFLQASKKHFLAVYAQGTLFDIQGG